jgi:protoporphyrinogen oxidase
MSATSVSCDIALLGAGPTCLGAAWRLGEIERARPERARSWLMFEAAPTPGGLASSVIDPAGFQWDLGGHVLYSHYEYFDALLDLLLAAEDWVDQPRQTFVHVRERFLPYPIQRNLHRLPPEDLIACLKGLLDVHREGSPRGGAATFREWCLQNFGRGLFDLFFEPFNWKMWAHPLESMSADWTGGRSGSRVSNVPLVDLARILECVVHGRDDPAYDATTRFRYPRSGGTGEIWRRLFARLPLERIEFGARLVRIEPRTRRLHFEDGRVIGYEHVVSGLPLDALVAMLDGESELRSAANHLAHTSTHVVGLGFDGPIPEQLAGKHWIYLPERSVPAYRASVLSNYSPHNVPHPGRQWSLLLEVSESQHRPVDAGTIASDCLASLRTTGLVPRDATVASVWHRRLPRGYPVPLVERDDVLDPIQERLAHFGIASRGRFGGWRYEVSNQDHSLMQGVEAIDAIVLKMPESTYPDPASVDKKVMGLREIA